jgi:hypothetical protein
MYIIFCIYQVNLLQESSGTVGGISDRVLVQSTDVPRISQGGAHGQLGARSCNDGLRTEFPAGSRGGASCGDQRGPKPPEVVRFLILGHPSEIPDMTLSVNFQG